MQFLQASGSPSASESARSFSFAEAIGAYIDIIAAMAVACVLFSATELWQATGAVRIIAGLAVGGFIPGYLLVDLLFPEPGDVDGTERCGLAVVLSAVILSTGLFLLSVANVRLNASSVVGALCVTVVVLGVAAAARRKSLPIRRRANLSLPRQHLRILVFLGVVLVLGVCLVVAQSTSSVRTAEFFATNAQGKLSGYPYQLHPGQRYALHVSLDNPNGETERYMIQASDVSHRLLWQRRVTLAPHGVWNRPVVLPAFAPPHDERLVLNVFQGSRRVRRLSIRYRIVW